jgi:hypothetical protein
MEETIKDLHEDKKKNLKPLYKFQECRVINYDDKLKILDVYFNEYGIRLTDIKDFSGDIAKIKYTGEIGKPDFIYQLAE